MLCALPVMATPLPPLAEMAFCGMMLKVGCGPPMTMSWALPSTSTPLLLVAHRHVALRVQADDVPGHPDARGRAGNLDAVVAVSVITLVRMRMLPPVEVISMPSPRLPRFV